MKKVLIVILASIVPFTMLLFVANFILSESEWLAQYRLEATLRATVQATSKRLYSELLKTLDNIVDILKAKNFTVYDEFSVVVTLKEIEEKNKLIEKILMFINPWGIIYPSTKTGLSVSSGIGINVVLDDHEISPIIRQELMEQESLYNNISFFYKNRFYIFRPLPGLNDVYIGAAFKTERITEMFKKMLEDVIKIDFKVYCATLPVLKLMIRDSFGYTSLYTESDEYYPLKITVDRPFEFIQVYFLYPDKVSRYIWKCNIPWLITILSVIGIISAMGIIAISAIMEIKRSAHKANIIAGISHDLRTPLSAIRLLAESLMMGHIKDKDRMNQYFKKIASECSYLANMIERIIYLIKFGQEGLIFNKDFCNISELILETVAGFSGVDSSIEEGIRKFDNGRFVIKVNVEEQLYAYIDPHAIRQLILNLLDNSVKYGRKENLIITIISHRIGYGIFKRRKGVYIEIKDNGQGIDREDMKKIFKPFQRGKRAYEENTGGFGLGLVMCKYIVSQHRGRILLESKFQEGLIVKIYLPAS